MSSSSDLETGITQHINEKPPKTKTKKKTKSTSNPSAITTDAHPKNEGNDPHWAYEPPEGAVRLDHPVDAGAFEWSAVKHDDDTEMWLLRVPESIQAKHLQGLEVDLPSSSRTTRIGGLTRKHTAYDVWSVGNGDHDDAGHAGAEELRGLVCLLPRKRKKGRLYIAPKRVSRRLVVSVRPPVATSPEDQPVVYSNPPRPSYPKEVLKHAFVPYGARSAQTRLEDVSMDVDDVEPTRDKPADTKEKPAKTTRKKRTVEGDSPKKSKKHKTKA